MTSGLLPRYAGRLGLAAALCLMAAPAFAAPTVNKGDVAFMFTSTVLVLLMTIRASRFSTAALRTKNMLAVLMQVLAIVCLVSIIWVTYGYSLAFTAAGRSTTGSAASRRRFSPA